MQLDSFLKKTKRKQAFVSLFSSLVFFTIPSTGLALPSHPEVISGSADISIDGAEMQISVSDQAILSYKDFGIQANEKVIFHQNSSKSCVLNKVFGENVSSILGKLESNGKVFLVNPNGVYFGKDAQVNVGSLIASTLDIANEDFLQERYRFTFQDAEGSIQNEGSLSSSLEGSIVLLSPKVQNQGIISAKAGHVLLAAGKEVTLDFTGDGLLQFSVNGSLKDAILQQMGEINALNGNVSLVLGQAQRVIQETLNLDGAEEGQFFLEENGKIYLASESSLLAKKAHLNGADLTIEGKIDVSSSEEKGGDLRIIGKDIFLTRAEINASGLFGGGEVLIGGEFQGKGSIPHASKVVMDSLSTISADALETGNGGRIVLWSHDHTIFHGSATARGGPLGGDGGLLETSSQGVLGSHARYMNVGAPYGKLGTWLLDPSQLTVEIESTGGGANPGYYPGCKTACGTCSTSKANLSCDNNSSVLVCSNFCSNGSCGNITFSASQSITVVNFPPSWGSNIALDLEEAGSLTFSSCTGSLIPVYIGGSVSVYGHSVTFDNTYLVLTGNVTIDTTHGGHSGGGDITVKNIQSQSSSYGLTLKSGTNGIVTMSTATPSSGNTYPGYIHTSTIKEIHLTGDVITSGSDINLTGAPSLTYASGGPSDDTVTTTIKSNGHSISLPTVNSATTRRGLTINSGSGSISVTSIGTDTSAPEVGDLTVTAGSFTSGAISTEGDVNISASSSASISSITTQDTSASSGTQGHSVTLSGGNFTVPTITTGTGDISTSGATLVLSSATTLQAISSSGADVTVGYVSGPHSLSIAAGNKGVVTLNHTISGINALNVIAAGLTTKSVSADSISQTGSSSTVNAEGTLTATSGGISLEGYNITVQSLSASGAISIDVSNSLNVQAGSTISGNTFSQTNGGGVDLLGNVQLTTSGTAFFQGKIAVKNLDASNIPYYTAGEGPFTVTNGGTLTIAGLYLNNGFTQNGTGSVSLGGDVTASSISLNTASGVTLTANATWNTASSNGAIVAGTIDSVSGTNVSLTLNPGSGTVSLQNIGATNPLSAFLLGGTSGVGLFNAKNITATGTISIVPPVTLSGSTAFIAPSINVGSNVTASSLANFTITATSSANFLDISTSGGYLAVTTGTGTIGDITTAGGNVDINGTTVTTGDITSGIGYVDIGVSGSAIIGAITTTGGNVDIIQATLTVTTGPITTGGGYLNADVSQATFGTISTSGGYIDVNATAAASFLGTISTGGNYFTLQAAGAFLGTITTSGGFFNGGTTAITLNATGDIETSGGAITAKSIDGFYDLTLNSGSGLITITGSLGSLDPLRSATISGFSPFSLPSITTTGTPSVAGVNSITINPSISLSKETSLLTTGKSYNAGGNILLLSTVDGNFSLVIDAGINGSATLSGDIGGTVPLASLDIRSGNVVSTQSIETNGSIKISSGATSQINGTVTTLAGSFDLINSGNMTFTDVVDVYDSFSQSGGGQLLTDADIVVTGTGSISIVGPLVLMGDIILSTTASDGDITIGSEETEVGIVSVLSQGGFFNLEIDAGIGDLLLLGDIGSSTLGIGAVTVSGGSATIQNIYTEGESIQIAVSAVDLAKNTTLDTTVGGGSGAISLPTVDGSFDLTINSGASALTVGTIGGTTSVRNVTISCADNFSLPSITTANGFIQINPSVSLVISPTLSTDGGDITFASTISGAQTLTLDAGDTGSIFLDDDVTGLTQLNIDNVFDLEALGISAGGLTQTNGSGTSTFAGDITIGASGINLKGSTFIFNDLIAIDSNGDVSIEETDNLTIGLATDFVITGFFAQTGQGDVELGGNIQTTLSISFEAPMTLTSNVILDSSTGNGDITLESYVISTPEGNDLDLNAGSGDVILKASLGSALNGLGMVTVQADSVTMNAIYTQEEEILVIANSVVLNGNATFTTTINSLTGANVTLPTVDGFFDLTIDPGTLGTITVDTIGGITPTQDVTIFGTQEFIIPDITTGSGYILVYPPTILDGDTTLTTNDLPTGADIHFFSTINGTTSEQEDLTLTAGSGSIFLDEAVGETIRLGSVFITSADNVNSEKIVATSIVQQFGLETTTFAGLLNTSGSSGIVLVGNNFVFKGAVTTEDGGNLEIFDAGSLIIDPEADITLGGYFLQSGGGDVSTGADITADSIVFTDPVVLTSDVVWNTSGDNGNITVESTINGPGGLTINTGLGDVVFEGTVGETSRLSYLNIQSNSTTFQESIIKTTENQFYDSLVNLEKNTGFSTVSGDIETTGPLDGTIDDINVVFSLGGGDLILSSLGSRHPLGSVLASNSGFFSTQDITARSLIVAGGLPSVEFRGPIELSGVLGMVVDAGQIGFGSSISAASFFLRAWTGPIYTFNSPSLLTSEGLSSIRRSYMSSMVSTIGSSASPIEINIDEQFLVGADNRADFEGPLSFVSFKIIPNSPLCVLTYNGEVLFDCQNQAEKNLFPFIAKNLFYLPGVYSSWGWDNLSSGFYFNEWAIHPEENGRERALFWLKSEKQKVSQTKKRNLSLQRKKVEIR